MSIWPSLPRGLRYHPSPKQPTAILAMAGDQTRYQTVNLANVAAVADELLAWRRQLLGEIGHSRRRRAVAVSPLVAALPSAIYLSRYWNGDGKGVFALVARVPTTNGGAKGGELRRRLFRDLDQLREVLASMQRWLQQWGVVSDWRPEQRELFERICSGEVDICWPAPREPRPRVRRRPAQS